MQDTAREARTNSLVITFNGPQYMDVPVLADQQELIYISCVRTQDVVWKTSQERWMTGTNGEEEPGKSMPAAWLDDDDDDIVNSHRINQNFYMRAILDKQ